MQFPKNNLRLKARYTIPDYVAFSLHKTMFKEKPQKGRVLWIYTFSPEIIENCYFFQSKFFLEFC